MEEKNSLKTNPLLELATPIISYAALFMANDKGKFVEVDFRQKIMEAFKQLKQIAFKQEISEMMIQHVEYALSAFIDEVVLNSSWSMRSQWMSNPLQLEFFGEHLAGEGFFDRLKLLRQGGIVNADILEVYYMCLQLGFEGVYRMRGLEKLVILQLDILAQIENMRGRDNSKVPSFLTKKANIVRKVSYEMPFWVVASVTVAAILMIYFIFTTLIDHQAYKKLKEIHISKLEKDINKEGMDEQSHNNF